MRLETIETVTLYIALPATALAAAHEMRWLEVPPVAHSLTLCTTPPDTWAGWNPFVVRAQVKAEYLSRFDAGCNTRVPLQLHIPPEGILDLNRNLVGPLSPVGDLPSTNSEDSAKTPSPDRSDALVLALP